MSNPDSAKVEVLKVWYSVFCTLVDTYAEGERPASWLIEKIVKLREELAQQVPEVEREMARHKQ
jgi:hypothetical protein